MRRREFILSLGALAALSEKSHGQQARLPFQIGLIMSNTQNDPQGQARFAAFLKGLHEYGWIPKQNIDIHLRWSGGDISRVQEYVRELVDLKPTLIVANGTPVLAAIKEATHSIPIVFVVVNDPVAQGFVANLTRPGGNITGFSFLNYSTVEKSLEMLKQVAPRVTRVAVMFNPDSYPFYNTFVGSLEQASRALSVRVIGAPVKTPSDIEEAFESLSSASGSALILPPDPYTINIARRRMIIGLAEQKRVPAIYFFREFVREGALISYGADTAEIFRRSATYVDRILRGTDPAILPIQAPTKFELAVNIKTAKALNLSIPPTLLALADEIVE